MTINSICSSISSAFSYAGHSISSAVSSALKSARALVQSLWNRVFPKTENQVPARSLAERVETLSGGAVEANHVSATGAHAPDALDQTPAETGGAVEATGGAVEANHVSATGAHAPDALDQTQAERALTLDTGATTTANPVTEQAQPALSKNQRTKYSPANHLLAVRVGRESSIPKPAATPATEIDITSYTQFPRLGAVRGAVRR